MACGKSHMRCGKSHVRGAKCRSEGEGGSGAAALGQRAVVRRVLGRRPVLAAGASLGTMSSGSRGSPDRYLFWTFSLLMLWSLPWSLLFACLVWWRLDEMPLLRFSTVFFSPAPARDSD